MLLVLAQWNRRFARIWISWNAQLAKPQATSAYFTQPAPQLRLIGGLSLGILADVRCRPTANGWMPRMVNPQAWKPSDARGVRHRGRSPWKIDPQRRIAPRPSPAKALNFAVLLHFTSQL
jgi:hypothetical protein